MGGEKSSQKGCGSCPAGSPPHGRGKAERHNANTKQEGITPAWAGKSLFCFAAAVPIQDHPRVGGEKLMPPLMGFWLRGSPPRGRGKAELSAAIDHVLGITPAYAGKRHWQIWRSPDEQDHPRIGGEKMHSERMPPEMTGSPPRRRGKVIVYITAWRVAGITPRKAGKSCAAGSPPLWYADHPRVGGEKVDG